MTAGPDATSDLTVFGIRLLRATPRLWVTHAIVFVNVAVFVAMLANGAGMFEPNSAVHLRWGANFGPLTKEGQWWRLAASTFLHFGLLHVAMNMWALWGVGRLVERLYGNGAFLTIYLFAGLTGSFASLLWNADKVVSAGASGAIFGVYGALAAYILREPHSVPATVLKSLVGSTLAFLAYSIVLGAVVSVIDNAAHAGGLAGGFALAWMLARPLEPRAPFGFARSAMAMSMAGALLASLYAAVPAPKYSYSAQQAAEAVIRRFAADEEALSRKASAIVDDRRAGRITDAQVAEAIEKDLLPGWNAANAEFAGLKVDGQAPIADKLQSLTRFVALRRDMFAEYAAGLKTGEAARIRRAEELSAESQRVMKALREAKGTP